MGSSKNRVMRLGYLACSLIALVLQFGCSGVKTYPGGPGKNLRVETKIDSGSAMRSTVAEFDIHRVDASCNTQYLGRVYLDERSITVGLPSDDRLYLDFIFASKIRLTTTINATRYATLLTTRPGHEYAAQVSYEKGIYSVVIHERRKGGVNRVVERQPLEACRPNGSAHNTNHR